MTGQEKLNQLINEVFEYPKEPMFFDNDPPWNPFKSNGTGDIPADWLQPSTSVKPTPKPIAPKLCPFRKHVHFRNSEDLYDVALDFANHTEEEFQPCLQEQCAVWNERMGACTY